MRQNVKEVYDWIVDDVVQKTQEIFAEEGIDASVLLELRKTWSLKVEQSGALGNHGEGYEWMAGKSSDRATTTPVKPSSKTSLISVPTHRMNTPPTETAAALRSHMSMSLPHKRIETHYTGRGFVPREQVALWPTPFVYPYHGTTAVMARQQTVHGLTSSSAAPAPRSTAGIMEPRLVRPPQYSHNGGVKPPPSQSNMIRVIANEAHHPLQLHQNAALTTSPSPQVRVSGKRKGSDGLMSHSAMGKAARRKSGDNKTSSVIPQRDGADDTTVPNPELDGNDLELYDTAERFCPEPELEDDSTLSDGEDEEELTESSNCLTAQYDKVSRIKNRWRCQLKHGIFHIDGRDYLFKTANGEFTF